MTNQTINHHPSCDSRRNTLDRLPCNCQAPSATKYLYRSIAAYGHEVFKCAGQVPAAELDFWIQHTRLYGATDSDEADVAAFDAFPGADRITFWSDRAMAPTAPLTLRDSGIKLLTKDQARILNFQLFDVDRRDKGGC